MNNLFAAVFVLFCCEKLVRCQSGSLPESTILIPGDDAPVLQAAWITNSTHLLLHLSAQTLGWVGFGISPTGQMDDSDILFGWCDDQVESVPVCHAQDRHIKVEADSRRVNLNSDINQDWYLINGGQNGSHTSLTVARRIISSDVNDYPFSESTTVIFAVGNADPDTETGIVTQHTQSGSAVLNLLSPTMEAFEKPILSPNAHLTDSALLNLIAGILRNLANLVNWIFLVSDKH